MFGRDAFASLASGRVRRIEWGTARRSRFAGERKIERVRNRGLVWEARRSRRCRSPGRRDAVSPVAGSRFVACTIALPPERGASGIRCERVAARVEAEVAWLKLKVAQEVSESHQEKQLML